jgi:hypothetical protein
VERFHKTLRAEFLTGKVFATVEEAQAALDAWVAHYNCERPHQSIGMVAPFERFRLARPEPATPEPATPEPATAEPATTPATTRRVGRNGLISFASAKYRTGVWLAGQDVTVICDGALVHLQHRGVLIATHARRHPLDKQAAGLRRKESTATTRRPTATSASVTRKVDSSGNVCFAGTTYRAGAKFRRRQVQVAVVGDMVEISIGTELIRTHPAKHDRTREHGALANPGGRPRRINAA